NNSDSAVQALRLATDTLTDTFTYTVKDRSEERRVGTESRTLHGADDAQVAVADTGNATEAGGTANGTPGSDATGNVLTNDTDVDAGDTKTVSAVNGVAGNVGSAVTGAHGSVPIIDVGSYDFAINNSDSAVQALRLATDTLTDTFTYTVKD